MSKIKKNDGFTLIELLIVVAIIGILAGIAVPQVSNVRSKANLSVIKADLRSIQTALEIYALDNDGYPATETEFSNIDFDDTDDYEYDVNEDGDQYLVYNADPIDGSYYYIDSSKTTIDSNTTTPSL